MPEQQKLKFPKGFLWGSATSAYQTEGNNTKSDWWAWEHSFKREQRLRAQGKDPKDFYSGIACDSYNRFDEDFALAEHLSQNAIRIGIEWSRIEPKEGIFDEKELDHYEKVLQSAKFHNLATFITLHHFTSPLWFFNQGGFANSQNIHYFVRYTKLVTERFSQYADFWLTFNEPEIYATHGYLFAKYPPQIKSLRLTYRVIRNLIKAHNIVSAFIRENIRKPVGMAYHLSDLQPFGFLGGIVTSLAHYFADDYILNHTIQQCDFIGANYYTHVHLGLFGRRKHSATNHQVTDVGWGIHPEGLERVLLELRSYKKPIYITENGLADAQDTRREKFIKDHLYYTYRAISQGADVRGYLHWSLIDNFEWAEGYGPRFGLVEIDREDFLRRKVRYSAIKYAEICKHNYLEYAP